VYYIIFFFPSSFSWSSMQWKSVLSMMISKAIPGECMIVDSFEISLESWKMLHLKAFEWLGYSRNFKGNFSQQSQIVNRYKNSGNDNSNSLGLKALLQVVHEPLLFFEDVLELSKSRLHLLKGELLFGFCSTVLGNPRVELVDSVVQKLPFLD